MKLSEAILMNGLIKEQGFGNDSMLSIDAPCALGGALQSIGRQEECIAAWEVSLAYKIVKEVWPWSEALAEYKCPCHCEFKDFPLNLVFHLNDSHKWSRARIAEWVASIEPDEPKKQEFLEEQQVKQEKEKVKNETVHHLLPI